MSRVAIGNNVVSFPDNLSPEELDKASSAAAEQFQNESSKKTIQNVMDLANVATMSPVGMAGDAIRRSVTRNPRATLENMPSIGAIAGTVAAGPFGSIPGGIIGKDIEIAGKQIMGDKSPTDVHLPYPFEKRTIPPIPFIPKTGSDAIEEGLTQAGSVGLGELASRGLNAGIKAAPGALNFLTSIPRKFTEILRDAPGQLDPIAAEKTLGESTSSMMGTVNKLKEGIEGQKAAAANTKQMLDEKIRSGVEQLQQIVVKQKKAAGAALGAVREKAGVLPTFEEQTANLLPKTASHDDEIQYLLDAKKKMDASVSPKIDALLSKFPPADVARVSSKANISDFTRMAETPGQAKGISISDIAQQYGTLEKGIDKMDPTVAQRELLALRQTIDDKVNYFSGPMKPADYNTRTEAYLVGMRNRVNDLFGKVGGSDELRAADQGFTRASNSYRTLQNNLKNPAKAEKALESVFTRNSPTAQGLAQDLANVEQQAGQPVVTQLKQAILARKQLKTVKFGEAPFAKELSTPAETQSFVEKLLRKEDDPVAKETLQRLRSVVGDKPIDDITKAFAAKEFAKKLKAPTMRTSMGGLSAFALTRMLGIPFPVVGAAAMASQSPKLMGMGLKGAQALAPIARPATQAALQLLRRRGGQ